MTRRGPALRFLGANRQVTGSRYLLEAGGELLGIECGQFQERAHLARNWEPPPVDPRAVGHLLLTHAHLDHAGLIPRFVKRGYRGPIHATAPTADLARIVLEDAGHINEEDAAYKRRRHEREGRRGPHPEVPLYTAEEARATFRQFRRVRYDRELPLGEGLSVCYRDAGHILGSALLELRVGDGPGGLRLVFSGDLGQSHRPLAREPSTVTRADYVVMESTYGDRDHEGSTEVFEGLARIINDTAQRGGHVVIPTFAIDRAQVLLYHLGELVRGRRIPRMTIFVDSPMAVDATNVYKTYKYLLDEEAQAVLDRGDHPFQFGGLHFVRSRDESRAINDVRDPCVVLAGSGMCTGGRVKHHLRREISREESTVLFVGFQAEGTLGRHILDGAAEVRIHGRTYPVRARIERLDGLSAHADRGELLRWLGRLESPPRTVFLTHGEASAAESLASEIRRRHGWEVAVPAYGDRVELA